MFSWGREKMIGSKWVSDLDIIIEWKTSLWNVFKVAQVVNIKLCFKGLFF